MTNLWPIEKRILAYLDQHGGSAHRAQVVADLVHPDSRIANVQSWSAASNRGEPRIMGAWCRRLIKRGWVRSTSHPKGYYKAHEITDAGRRGLRESGDVKD